MPSCSTQQKAAATFDALATLIQACQDAGELSPGDPHKMARLMYSTVHGLIDLEIGGRFRDSKEWNRPEEIVELLVALFTHAERRVYDTNSGSAGESECEIGTVGVDRDRDAQAMGAL